MTNLSTMLAVSITLIVVIAVIALIYFAKKYEVVKIVAILVIYAALIGGAFYSCKELNSYYSAEGGIIGQLFQTQTNKADVTKSDIKISDVEMIALGDSKDTYMARVVLEDKFTITPNACYLIEVNGMPCTYVMNGDAGATVRFGYVFTKENNVKVLDTLTISLILEENYNLVTLSIEDGANKVGLWQEFFNRKGCTIHIQQVNASKFAEKTSNLQAVTLMLNNQVYKKTFLLKGMTYALPELDTIELDGYKVKGYSANGKDITESSFIVQDSVDITIKTVKVNTVTLLDADGSQLKKIKLEAGETIKPEDMPTKSADGTRTIAKWTGSDGSVISVQTSLVYPSDGGDPKTITQFTITTSSGSTNVEELEISQDVTYTAVYTTSPSTGDGDGNAGTTPRPGGGGL